MAHHQPKYVLIWNHGTYAILNDDANYMVGCVHPIPEKKGFRVTAELDEGSCHVGVVEAVQEAIAALADFYEKNPPQWKLEDVALWKKDTQYGLLRVEQDREGQWRAYRDDYPMLRENKPAAFRTVDDARSAADAHVLDLYLDREPVNDGLSWLPNPEIDWRSRPHCVENRMILQHLARDEISGVSSNLCRHDSTSIH